MGVSEGEGDVVAVVTDGDEAAAEQRVRKLLGGTDAGDTGVSPGDADTIKMCFDIGDREIAVVDGDLEDIVLERVALLDVET